MNVEKCGGQISPIPLEALLKLNLSDAEDVSKRVKATLLFLSTAGRSPGEGAPPA